MFHKGNVHLLGGLGPYLSYAAGGEILYKSVSGLGSNEPKRRKMIFGTNGYSRVDAGLTVLVSVILKNRWILSFNHDQGLTNTDEYS